MKAGIRLIRDEICPECISAIVYSREIGGAFYGGMKTKVYVSWDCLRCHRHGIGYVSLLNTPLSRLDDILET